MNLKEFCHLIHGTLLVTPGIADLTISGVTVSVEEAGPTKVFFALCQLDFADNCFNGNFQDSNDTDIVPKLLAKGTKYCVMRWENFERNRGWLHPYRAHIIVVDDAIAALQRVAREALARSSLPVIAVTGSAGKTTTKELIVHVLSGIGRRVLYSVGNQNNGLGLPLTVQKLLACKLYDTAVLEMGMSTRNNEIARLCKVAPPDIAVVLNVLPVHMEHMLTVDSVQEAKAQIVEGSNPGGIAVLNADDPRVLGMRNKAARSITFGMDPGADVRAADVRFARGGTTFTLLYRGQSVEVTSTLRGEYNVMNLLAASVACLAYDPQIELRALAQHLASFRAPPQRGTELALGCGITLIDDTYNSNPRSLLLAAEAARDIVEPGGRLIVVAGGMHELGLDSFRLHVETGAALAQLDVDALVCVGKHADGLVEGFRSACPRTSQAHDSLPSLVAFLEAWMKPLDVLLIKGSRAERLENLVKYLSEMGRVRGSTDLHS